MSLEDSMKDLAESNRELAKAQKYYAGVIEKFGLKVENDNGEKTDKPAAEDKKPGRPKGSTKPKPAPVEEEEEDDGLGGDEAEEEEEEEESSISADEVKAKLKELGEATERSVASAIFRDMGFKSFPDIPDNKLQAVYDAAVKALKKAKK
jgi:hypothetical protein